MNQELLVSIIVPVYNAERYLYRCLESIRNQTYRNIEIILVDDGSEDDSLTLCKKKAVEDERIKVYHQENQGVSATRNHGIELAHGHYIVFVDSDDAIENNMIEQLVKVAKPEYLVLCRFERVAGTVEPKHNIQYIEGTELDINSFWSLWRNNLIHSPCNKLYEKGIIGDKIRFNTELSLGEDLLFNLEYLTQVRGFIFLNRSLYYYIDHGVVSLSRKYYKDGFEIQVKLYQELIQFCQKYLTLGEQEWADLFWDYFKALQSAIDAEYEKNAYVITKEMFEKLNCKVFKDVLQEISKNRRYYRMINRFDFFLYKHNMIKVDYLLRKARKIQMGKRVYS